MSELVTTASGWAVWAREYDREIFRGYDSPKFVAVSKLRALLALADYIKENIDRFVIESDLVALGARVAFDEQGDEFEIEIEIEYTDSSDPYAETDVTIHEWRLIENLESESVKVISVQ